MPMKTKISGYHNPDDRKPDKRPVRKIIYDMVEFTENEGKIGRLYDYFMIAVILISIIPLTTKSDIFLFHVIDRVTLACFIIDYLLRLVTADYKYGHKSEFPFIRYPFTFMAIIDLIAILPSLKILDSGFKLLRVFRIVKVFRVFRIFKIIRYFKSVDVIRYVFKKAREPLAVVSSLAVAYILVMALLVFHVEPNTFHSYLDAVYWATVSLMTIGYGDLYTVTEFGKMIAIISSFVGVAIVALPTGIITAVYMNEVNQKKEEEKED